MDGNEKQTPTTLIPEEGGLLARVDPYLAKEIILHRANEDDGYNNTRVSDIFVSRYGVMGYAEYSITQEVLGGIIEVPKKLTLLLQLKGEQVYRDFKQEIFGNHNLEDHIENLSIDPLADAKFLDEVYYYAFTPSGFGGVGRDMKSQIDSVCSEVKDFLMKIDTRLDSLRSEKRTNPQEDYRHLQLHGLVPG